MPALESLCQIVGVSPLKFSKEENLLLEAELLTGVYEKLRKVYTQPYQKFLLLIKDQNLFENITMENHFVRCLINDILASEEYTLSGIAYYTHTPEDVIYEIISGDHSSPSVTLFRKIIELHRSVRPYLYREIINKLLDEARNGK